MSCNGGGLLPANVTAIVSFLLANGYSHNAAAGIAGNIYQESKGNPESVGMGGGGLIGWTPLQSGMVTGNYSADLQTQLKALLDLQPDLVRVHPGAELGVVPGLGRVHLRDGLRARRHPRRLDPRAGRHRRGRRLRPLGRSAPGEHQENGPGPRA